MSDEQANPKVINRRFAAPADKRGKEQAKAVQELSGTKNDLLSMEVKVSSPFMSYFVGRAFSISGVNATGPFDILPGHHSFFSLLDRCTLTIRTTSGDEQKIDIGGGLIHVKADKVIVFLDV